MTLSGGAECARPGPNHLPGLLDVAVKRDPDLTRGEIAARVVVADVVAAREGVLDGVREAVRQWRDIAPISATSTDEESAANALFDVALEELQRRSVPALTVELAITHCPQVLRPMQTIRCIFRRVAQGRVVASIDEQLNIIEATTTIDRQRGLRTTGLTVSTARRYPETDADPIVNLVRTSQLRG